ncbi:MAG: helix-turn-helix domain-containing protein [Chloroflexales bacterium]|nr:helix-turn-helix domain-containing protein [Chloroflexales bacterium]
MVEEAYYTAEEVSKLFRVTKAAVYKWIREGKLGFVWVGSEKRIPTSAIKDFVRPGNPDESVLRQKNVAPTLG